MFVCFCFFLIRWAVYQFVCILFIMYFMCVCCVYRYVYVLSKWIGFALPFPKPLNNSRAHDSNEAPNSRIAI